MAAKGTYFSGRVHSVIFENEAKAFYILKMALDLECLTADNPANIVTVRGDIPGVHIAVGTWFGFEGVWDDHPQHGRQIKVTRAPVIKNDWDPDTVERILTSNKIVGHSLAALIRTQFGATMAHDLLDPEKLQQVPGLTRFTAQHISQKWQLARAHFLTMDFLHDLGLPPGRIRQVWSMFGEKAQEALSVNPWSLVQIEGITFEDADTVAGRLNLDCSHSNPLRVQGAVLHASRSGKGFGHLYSSSGDILAAVRSIDPLISDRDVALALRELTLQGILVLDRSTLPGVTAIYDPWSHTLEVESAKLLVGRLTGAVINQETANNYIAKLLGEPKDVTLREAAVETLTKIGSSGGITLAPKQMDGVINALTEPVSIITGLPGTGKTTCLRMALLLLHEAGIHSLTVAPTGIAAKRMASVTGSPAFTIHRAFKAKGCGDSDRESTYDGIVGDSDGVSSDGSDETWGFGLKNPHPADVIILDESSMVDQHILYRVLTCTKPDARLVFVGDAAQLPSVGPGNVLRDIIASKRCATVALTEIFRQAETSPIILAAHHIHHGIVPDAPKNSDFALHEFHEESEIAQKIVNSAVTLFEKRINFQVLSPRHGGVLGVTSLNSRLREVLNPKQPSLQEVKLGTDVLREGDRIMVVKNDYKLGIYNGDVGKIESIDKRNKVVEIKIHGPPIMLVKVPFKQAQTLLRLAYAVTVHKMQGQEADVIILPLVNSFGHQLQRNLFYTAVTRARKRVVMLGQTQAMERAVKNDREGARNTLFLHRLLESGATNTP